MISSYIHICYSFLCKCICKREVYLHIKPCCTVVIPNLSKECIICRDYLYNSEECIYRICYQCKKMYHKKCYADKTLNVSQEEFEIPKDISIELDCLKSLENEDNPLGDIDDDIEF